MTERPPGSGSRSAETLADFSVIGIALREVLRRDRVRMKDLEKEQGWYTGIISAWLRGAIALPADRFFEILAAINLGTHEFFRIVYPMEEVPERSNSEHFEAQGDMENLTTCLRLHLRHAIRSRGYKQLQVERIVGWTPRYLSTILSGRQPLSLLHCLAIVRAVGLTPAQFFLSLDCERAQDDGEQDDGEDEKPAES